MSAKINDPKPEETLKDEVKKPILPTQEEPRPMTIMTENDAYIAERMKGQPKSLAEIELVQTREEANGVTRVSLPEYFETFSHDCTRGTNCQIHGWKVEQVHYGLDVVMPRYIQTKRGKYIFRWLNKNKKALDFSINVRGWYLVNRSYFSDAPKILFSVNGGVENGDSILAFMSFEKALAIRKKPSKDSHDRVHSEENKHEGNPNFYKAKLDPERSDGDDFAPSGSTQVDLDGTIIRR